MQEMFETEGENGQICFDEEKWNRWSQDRLNEYPCPRDHYRFDLELSHPRRILTNVPVERDPHGGGGAHVCFYESDNWSTIFGVHGSCKEELGHRILVESNCPHPIWGERITLLSTSSSIEDEPWGINEANKFAFFRGYYWRLTYCKFLHDWVPLSDGRPNMGFPRQGQLRGQSLDFLGTSIFADMMRDRLRFQRLIVQNWNLTDWGNLYEPEGNLPKNWIKEGF